MRVKSSLAPSLFLIIFIAHSASVQAAVKNRSHLPSAKGEPSTVQTAAPEPDLQTLLEERAQMIRDEAEKLKKLNSLNPFSDDYGKASFNTQEIGSGPWSSIHRLLSQPAVQAYLKLFSNPEFTAGINQIIQSPNRMQLLYTEIGWLIFLMVFRSWRTSRFTHWASRLWIRVYCFCGYWAGAVIVIPWILLGQPYAQLIKGIIENIMKK